MAEFPFFTSKLRSAGYALILAGLCSSALADSPSITVKGGDKKLRQHITDYLQVSKLSCDLPSWRYASLKRSLVKDSRKALRAVGYYAPKLKLSLQTEESCFKAELDIDPGIGVMVKDVDIQVSEQLRSFPEFQQFLKNLPNSRGQLLEHRLYDETRNQIEALANRFGFFDGHFTTRQLDVDTDTHDAYFRLHYEAGTRYRLGEIDIDKTQFNNELMAQYIQLHTGDAFDSRKLIKQQQLLSDSSFFQGVEVIALREQRDHKNHTVPIRIRLKKRKRSLHKFGVGASTDVGPRLSYSLDRRWVNKKGHTFGWDTAVSPVTRSLSTRYGIPRGDGGKSRLDLQTGYLYEKSDSNETATFKAAATLTKSIGQNWNRAWSLEYLTETYTAGDDESFSEMLLPGIRWHKVRADNAVFPRDGWRLNSRIRTAFDALLSDTDLFQITLKFKSIVPAGKGRLIGRFDAGLSSVSDFDSLPASLRFFAGGDGSIRGFDYESLGPEDSDGDVVGGKHLLVGSIEYEHPITRKWGVAVFTDYGNAFDDLQDSDFNMGAGIGIRWHSPLGPIRVDVAKGVVPEHGVRLHLSMGTDL